MMKGSQLQYPHVIGLEAHRLINQSMKKIEEDQAHFLQWMDEVLVECKKTFSKSDIGLLPKTPSAKRRRAKTKVTKHDDSDVFELEQSFKQDTKENMDTGDEDQPRKRSRTQRAASRTVPTTSSSSSSSSSRSTRLKQQKTKMGKDPPLMSLNAVIVKEKSVVDVKTPESDKLNFTKLSQNKVPQVSLLLHKCASPGVQKAGHGHVKDKVHTFEELIEVANSPITLCNTSCVRTPVTHSTPSNDACPTGSNIPETPEQDQCSPKTPATITASTLAATSSAPVMTPDTVTKSTASTTPNTATKPDTDVRLNMNTSSVGETPTNIHETPNTTLTTVNNKSRPSNTRSRRSSRASLAKSLKKLSSQSKLDGSQVAKLKNQLQMPRLVASISRFQDSPGATSEGVGEDTPVGDATNAEKRTTHTKLKLKKKEKIVDGPVIVSQTLRMSGRSEDGSGTAKHPHASLALTNQVLDSPTASHHVDESFEELVIKNMEIVYVEDSEIELLSEEEEIKDHCVSDKQGVTDASAKIHRLTFNAKDLDHVGDHDKPCVKAESTSTDYGSSDTNVCVKPIRASARTKQKKPATSSVDEEEQGRDSGIGKETDPIRSTRSKMRKPNTAPISVDSSDADDERMGEEEPVPIRQSTRTKQRKQTTNSTSSDLGESITDKPVRSSSRTKQRKNTATSSASSVDEEPMEMNSEKEPSMNTRSKMRKPRPAPVVSCSSDEADDPFVVPDAPPTRPTRTKTRKRALDEDNSCDESMSKKSCTELSQIEDSFEQLERLCNATDSSDEHGTKASDDVDSTEKNWVSVPSFVHNLSKVLPAVGMSNGIVKSFIKRNTPPPKLTAKQIQEERKKVLHEKARKDEQRLQQRDALLKMRIEEQRKKREERMKRAAEQRQNLQKRDDELKTKLQKQREEKLQLTENHREEKLKEDQEKQRTRNKKNQEAEERRKQDEEERIRRLKEQEEEEKKAMELLQKKKEQENRERQRQILEERRRVEERQAEYERERQAEQERLKRALEQQEQQKEAERQRQKEQKEKAAALAQAEKERQELEKKKDRDIQMKKAAAEKQQELAKKQEMRDKQKEEQKRQAEELQNLIAKHNASVATVPATAPDQAKKPMLPKPVFNTTQNMSQSNTSDSYEMTPMRKNCVFFENYDITDMRSDDSTDDEDKPKRKIPAWALGANLKALLINQHYHPPNLERLFGIIDPPDLNELFAKKKARFNKRTSSAHWDSPIMRPGVNYL